MSEKIMMGRTQELVVVKIKDHGVYVNTLDGDESEKILLPKAQVPEGIHLRDVLTVFVYRDSEDRPIATMEKPALELGGVARLHVKAVTGIGAFLDWGLAKDLLLPFKQQLYKVREGDNVLVTLYLDKSDRLCASMHVYERLRNDSSYSQNDEVSGRVYEISENFGVFVAVDDMYSALIPKKEVFEQYTIGQPITARVARVLEDGRLSLSVRKKIPDQMLDDAEFILNKLRAADGFLPYHDKSDPEQIKAVFHMSKNAFKRAIGRLMKNGQITIASDGIRII